MTTSYHNHSTWSDGKTAADEMIAAGRRLGLEAVGISDHWVLHPRGRTPAWSMPQDKLGEYTAHLRSCANNSGIPVLIGLEVDWFSETGDEIRRILADADLDYTIGSVHFIDADADPLDGKSKFWKSMTQAEVDAAHGRYWSLIREMAESRLFTIAAHLDLPKKFGVQPSTPPESLIHDALDAIARAEMAVELNTSGWSKPCKNSYPSREILQACRKRGIPIVITADAHRPEHLARDFDRAERLLAEAGYKEDASEFYRMRR